MTAFEWEGTGAPERYYGAMFDDCPAEVAEAFKRFCEGQSTDVLIVTGGNGTAKTKTACASIYARADKGLMPGLFLSCKYQLCPMFRSSRLSNGGITEYDLYKKYYEAPYLVIDEYGKGDNSELERAVVRNILSARYDKGNLTALITNYTMKELVSDTASGLGEDIRSRFKETATVLTLEGCDWRKGSGPVIHIQKSERKSPRVKCIICGGEMTSDGFCTNPQCVAFHGNI